ncbi:MAG TPA: SLBB domain-containing protein [Vicinamibacterales bacterium]|nr:SLBB domain-containing protein [Vicinamibacterales bacterium]
MTTVLLLVTLQITSWQQPPPRPATTTTTTTTTAPSANGDYRVGPQDKLNITVLGIPDFSAQNVLVENDGKFDYINLGRIVAQDKTVQEIQKAVRDLLISKGMHMNPPVTVDVADFRSQMVIISGAVKNSGSIRITGNETLLNVLAQAGFTANSGSYVEVTRNKPLPARKFRFERRALETGSAEPFRLQDQDTIVVPEAEKAYVRGEVKSPGTYEVTANMTVLQLIISAGDLTDKASNARVTISRPSSTGGKAETIKVPKDLSTIVQPGDTISVGKRIF